MTALCNTLLTVFFSSASGPKQNVLHNVMWQRNWGKKTNTKTGKKKLPKNGHKTNAAKRKRKITKKKTKKNICLTLFCFSLRGAAATVDAAATAISAPTGSTSGGCHNTLTLVCPANRGNSIASPHRNGSQHRISERHLKKRTKRPDKSLSRIKHPNSWVKLPHERLLLYI